jgi:hypothetical protein
MEENAGLMGTAFAHDSFLEVNVSRAFQWKKGLQ